MISLRRDGRSAGYPNTGLDNIARPGALLPAFTDSLPRLRHDVVCKSVYWSNVEDVRAVWANDEPRLYCASVPNVRPRSGLLTALTLCSVISACSVYDTELIGSKPQGVGSVPTGGRAAGSGGKSGSKRIEDAGEPDSGNDADHDSSLPTSPIPIDVHCGDGRITGDEKCDIGVPDGMPGSCPTKCPELAKCNPRSLNNSGCQAECVVLQLVCMDDDDCCPGNCTDKNDSDCSSRCGDGMIQADDGETCEAESTTPCKSSDAQCDDKDSCTVDKLVGSAKNCNSQCTNTKVTAPKNDDACCPSGADANNDNDCKPVCGNKIREMGEDCDGTTGCSAACKLTLQPDQIACIEKFATSGDECAKCSCMNCTPTYMACRAGEDAKANDLCNGVLECSSSKGCYGSACYCGGAFLCNPPTGRCRAEVEAAAGSTDVGMVGNQANDANTTLGKAYVAETCRYEQCQRRCY